MPKFSMTQKVAGLAVAGVIALGGAGAVAYADSGSTTTKPATPSSAAPAAPAAPGAAAKAKAKAKARTGAGLEVLRGADHGTLDVRQADGTYKTVTFDRGKVTAASATSITLARPDGKSVTLKVTADTKFKGIASADKVQVGQDAVVVSNGDTATTVAQRDPAKAAVHPKRQPGSANGSTTSTSTP